MRDEFCEKVEKGRRAHPSISWLPMTERGEKNGFFMIRNNGNGYIFQISHGGGWDHVSMSLFRKKRCPSWEEMCWAKDLFFKPTELVVQFHPPDEEHVNLAQYCLHLWRYHGSMPKPDYVMIGPLRK